MFSIHYPKGLILVVLLLLAISSTAQLNAQSSDKEFILFYEWDKFPDEPSFQVERSPRREKVTFSGKSNYYGYSKIVTFQLKGANTLIVEINGCDPAEFPKDKFLKVAINGWPFEINSGKTQPEIVLQCSNKPRSKDPDWVWPILGDGEFHYPLPKDHIERGYLLKLSFTFGISSNIKGLQLRARFASIKKSPQ